MHRREYGERSCHEIVVDAENEDDNGRTEIIDLVKYEIKEKVIEDNLEVN